MAYWLDEAWHRWPEIAEAGTAAAGLYSRCGSYIADSGTDGFVPSAIARMYGTHEWIQRLVGVGLWTVEEKGFRDQRYFPLNKTKKEIDDLKASAAARQRAHYRRKTSRVSDASSHASGSHHLTRSPFPPPSEGKGKGARPLPRWCGRCNADLRMYVGDDDAYHPCPDCHPERGADA